MNWVVLILLSFLQGVIVKYVDQIEDLHLDKSKILRVVLGAFYGVIIFSVIYLFPFMAPLWLGTVLGLLLYGKIDALSHYVGVGVLFLLLIALGIPELSVILFILFTLVNFFEEFLNYILDSGKIKNKIVIKIVEVRPLLEITAFVVSLITGVWLIWIALLSFDVAYVLIGKVVK